jgi:FtsZ-binding cell division protein ZapB
MANIGDLIPKAGIYTEQGVVIEKKPDGSVVVDTEPMTINKFHRYANTTGLTELEKTKFNSILDQIYTKVDDVEKINDIQQEIDRLKSDPAHQNVVQYLRNQQAHLIRTAKQLPRTYNWDESSLKV